MKKINIFVLLIAIILIGCERDDICAETTPTTPRLRVEFYDATSPEDLKSVTSLTLYGEELVTDPTEFSAATIVYNTNENEADLPLKISSEGVETTSRFVLEKDSNLRIGETGTSNKDIIEISYLPQFEYVSRACGYKSIFNNLNVTLENDSNNWISSIDVIETTVKNENTVHVRIFH
jgi:hypothetical protein